MRYLNKTLAATAAATALMAALGAAVAQTGSESDPMATPQQVDVTGSTGDHIYFFRDQGNSPETDPAAHLLLIKHDQMRPMPVAESTTTTTTTVAQATTPAEPAPAPAVVVNDTSANNMSTDTTAMPADTAPVLAPKADRN
jgi:hypothetical protein